MTVTSVPPAGLAYASGRVHEVETRPTRDQPSDPAEPLRVALLGCGTVGSEVARLIIGQADDLRARVGRPLQLVGIAVRRAGRERPGIDPALFTTDAAALVARDDVDLVIEVIGGIEPARSLILSALRHGASVVTANKALLAEDGATLFAAAEDASSDLYFEASVAGAIPIIRPLRESLVGDEITAVIGIVNGTTNFILDKMDAAGAGFAETLAEAQELGYAEADPTADVEGFDAAAKAAILASLAFHTRVTAADVYREGITEVTSSDIASAAEIGCVVKLLAICQLLPPADGRGRAPRVRAGAPGDDPAQPPPGRGRRRLQRRLRGVPVGRAADVLRPRRRRLADRERRARRPGHRGPQPGPRRGRAGGVELRGPSGRPDRQRADPLPPLARGRRTSPGCWPRSRRCSPSTTCRSRPCASSSAGPTPSWSWSPTRRWTPR